jgi:hypothetical protein
MSSEVPRPQGGTSRRGSFIHIVPLDPAYKAGLAGHVPVKKATRYKRRIKPVLEDNDCRMLVSYPRSINSHPLLMEGLSFSSKPTLTWMTNVRNSRFQ